MKPHTRKATNIQNTVLNFHCVCLFPQSTHSLFCVLDSVLCNTVPLLFAVSHVVIKTVLTRAPWGLQDTLEPRHNSLTRTALINRIPILTRAILINLTNKTTSPVIPIPDIPVLQLSKAAPRLHPNQRASRRKNLTRKPSHRHQKKKMKLPKNQENKANHRFHDPLALLRDQLVMHSLALLGTLATDRAIRNNSPHISLRMRIHHIMDQITNKLTHHSMD